MDLEFMKKNEKSKNSKKVTKKITRRRRKVTAEPVDPTIIINIDQVYSAINRVQLTRERVTFKVLRSDSAVIDNILKDLSLIFKKKDSTMKVKNTSIEGAKGAKTCVQNITEYHVDPAPVVENELDFDELDEFPDELLEDGQLFF